MRERGDTEHVMTRVMTAPTRVKDRYRDKSRLDSKKSCVSKVGMTAACPGGA
jgi:hypothetical protein